MPDIRRNLSRKVIVPVFSIWALAACSNTAVMTGNPMMTRESVNSDTPAYTQMPTLTPTATPTPTVTPTPTITFTPTPLPDLEFTEVTISPDTFDEVNQDYLLMGRIRNNTNQTMRFTNKFVAFRFDFEIWDWDKNNKEAGHDYHHAKFQYEIPGREINCFLFPGEEGVMYFWINYSVEKKGISEYVDSSDGPFGMWYTYESFYIPDPDIPRAYRIEAQNLWFDKFTNSFEFAFDVDLSKKYVKYEGQIYGFLAWVIIYDKEGTIINILSADISFYPGFRMADQEKGILHIDSNTHLNAGDSRYFRSATKMTPELIERADRIEVMTEIEEIPICYPD